MNKIIGAVVAIIIIVSTPVFLFSEAEDDNAHKEHTYQTPALQTSVLNSTNEDDFEYTILSDGTITITRYLGTESDIIIPNMISGYSVTSISNSAFYQYEPLLSVIIPEGVTSIGYRAFANCHSLKSITLPDSIVNLEYYAFEDCHAVAYLSMPVDLNRYDVGAFNGLISLTLTKGQTGIGPSYYNGTGLFVPWSLSDLAFIKISDGVIRIGEYMFSGSSSLVDVSISNTVTSIGRGAFHSCTSLTSIKIPDSVVDIEPNAFYGCSSLTDIEVSANNSGYTSVDGVLYSKDVDVLIKCPTKKAGTVHIPDSVVQINDCAFHGCSSVMHILIGSNVSNIRDLAFSGCSSLTSISIPSSVVNIGNQAFYGCPLLEYIEFKGNAPTIGNNIYSGNVKIYHTDTATGFDSLPWINMNIVESEIPPLSLDKIKNIIDNNDEPEIEINENFADYEIDTSVFEKLSNENKSLKIDILNEDGTLLYSWIFEGEFKESTMGTFRTGISTLSPSGDINEAISAINATRPFILKFAAEGELPIDAKVRYFLDDEYENGSKLTLFFYNETTKQLEEVEQSLTVEDGWINFNLTHCSIYVFAEIPLAISPEENNTSYVSIIIAITAIMAILMIVLIKKR